MQDADDLDVISRHAIEDHMRLRQYRAQTGTEVITWMAAEREPLQLIASVRNLPHTAVGDLS